jgi:uncharacterized short protein YbdD (DUF466 family)
MITRMLLLKPAEKMARQARRYELRVLARRVLRKIWRGLREWCGDAAYERYLRSPRTRASSSPTLTPKEFYTEQLNRRYSRPNRCC